MLEHIFIELGIIILVAVGVSAVMRVLKQPLIIGYIITGIIVGPYFLNASVGSESVRAFSHLGIAFLLFIAGLSLSPKLIRSVGKVSVVTGVGQMIFTFIPTYLLSLWFGFSNIASMYIGFAMAFSSTIIIVKLLSDKDNLETMYGRIVLGLLIVQDIAAIIILMAISSFSGGFYSINMTLDTILKGIGMLATVTVFSLWILPKLHEKIAKSQEFLLLFSIGWLILISSIFGYMNFSIEIGALIAGVTLAGSPYAYEIKAKMKSLRDFFLLFFFVLLGSQMMFVNIMEYIIPIAIFSSLVLFGIPVMIMSLMGFMRYTRRNSFLTGIAAAQISEFSFILVALGVSMGHLGDSILSMVTAIGIITFFASTYFIEHGNRIYSKISKYLKIFERPGPRVEGKAAEEPHEHHHEVILFGCNRTGMILMESIKKLKKGFLVVDYNPDTINDLIKKKYHCKYGDANDLELLNSLDFKNTKMIVSTIPDLETNLLILKQARRENKNIIIIAVSHQIDEALKLHESGATYVLMPYFLGAQYASTMIERDGIDIKKFLEAKTKQIKHLRKRIDMQHRHPKREKDR